jgi:transcriptional regulator GlxA family with amidase domain
MQIAIGLYDGFTALDAIGPYQVFTLVPGVDVKMCAAQTGRVVDDNKLLRLDVEHSFAELAQPDIVVVPGGVITRRMAAERHPIVDWIAGAHPHTTWTTSVCTGAVLLGAAGVLDGLNATTHWYAYDQIEKFGATPTEERVVIEGKVVTGAGVSAGIDMALTLVGRIYGPEVAQAIQLGIEYDPQPPYDAGAPSKADEPIRELVSMSLAASEAALAGGGG